MTALIATIFLASLMGSLHCAAMCGAFMACATTPSPFGEGRGGLVQVTRNRRSISHSKSATQLAYQFGRLMTYTALGALAGAFGSAVDHTSALAGFQRGAAAFAGAAMIVFGLLTLLRILGVRLAKARPPELLRRTLVKAHSMAFELPPLQRAAAVGLLTTLLPCGWLYAFVISAAGTGSATNGALAMSVFWLGTLPVMVTVGAGIQSLTGALRTRLPLITSAAVIAMGLFTIAQRFTSHHHLPGAIQVLEARGGSHAECNP